jgi:RNA recognition motif-containing protein
VRINTSGYKLNISRPPGDYDESKTLFICALPHTTTSQKIVDLFPSYESNIKDIRLKLEKDKNYAYVEFDTK